MLTLKEARLQASLELRRRGGDRTGPEEIVIRDEFSREVPAGWLFFYNSRGFLDGDEKYKLYGNVPMLVGRKDGSTRFIPFGEIGDWFAMSDEFEGRHTTPAKPAENR